MKASLPSGLKAALEPSSIEPFITAAFDAQPADGTISRRGWLRLCVALAGSAATMRVSASTLGMELAIQQLTGGRVPTDGDMTLEVPALVENGNSVPVRIAVNSPMTEADHVRRIALFSEKNPLPQVAVFHLSPRSGRATVATRMRLADSQRVVALAELSDGRWRRQQVDVIVTLAACIEN